MESRLYTWKDVCNDLDLPTLILNGQGADICNTLEKACDNGVYVSR